MFEREAEISIIFIFHVSITSLKSLVFESEARNFNHFYFHVSITSLKSQEYHLHQHSYHKKIARKSTLECKSIMKNTRFTFSCCNYVTQITRISLASLTHTTRKLLENQRSNANSIITYHFTFSCFNYVTQITKYHLQCYSYHKKIARKSTLEHYSIITKTRTPTLEHRYDSAVRFDLRHVEQRVR